MDPTIRDYGQILALILFFLVTLNFLREAFKHYNDKHTEDENKFVATEAAITLLKGQAVSILIRIIAGIGEIFCIFFK